MLIEVIIKLILALLLGGLIGFEREYMSRPAGLRTHVLVCVGAAVVQIISINFYTKFHGTFNNDPMRLGAQVISGIGFLGAGTILKEGTDIKGLTTAASLWTVACIGLATGSGLYMEATTATVFIYAALKGLRRVEALITKDKKSVVIKVLLTDIPGKVGELGSVFGSFNLSIINLEMQSLDDNKISIEFTLKHSNTVPAVEVIDKLSSVGGVKKVEFM
jgi:putative Mg2+ transporter-C (MgtC) family protein